MSTYNQYSYQDPYFSRDPRQRRRPQGRPPVDTSKYQFRRRVTAISMLGLLLAPVAWAMRDDGKPVDVAYSGGAAAVMQFNPSGGPGDTPAVEPPVVVSETEATLETPVEAAPATVPVTQPEPAAPQPVVCASEYTVQLGDSWYGVADAAGVKASLIAGVNNRTLKDTLLVGEEICLPEGAAVPPVKTTPATTAAKTEPKAPSCSGKYVVKAGDSWNRIGNLYSVSAKDLAAVNRKTLNSMLLVGESLCLPAGAKAPSPSAAPPTPAAPAKTYSRAEMEQLVRDIWPDELEENAFYVVYRESRWVPTAKNFCCYGLFQLNWLAHQSWMRHHGISDPAQLMDAETNIRLAYVVYQRSNSWRPWCTTNWCPVE